MNFEKNTNFYFHSLAYYIFKTKYDELKMKKTSIETKKILYNNTQLIASNILNRFHREKGRFSIFYINNKENKEKYDNLIQNLKKNQLNEDDINKLKLDINKLKLEIGEQFYNYINKEIIKVSIAHYVGQRTNLETYSPEKAKKLLEDTKKINRDAGIDGRFDYTLQNLLSKHIMEIDNTETKDTAKQRAKAKLKTHREKKSRSALYDILNRKDTEKEKDFGKEIYEIVKEEEGE